MRPVLRRDDVSRTARLVAACRALDHEIIERRDVAAGDLAGKEALAHAAALPALVAGVALRTRWIDDHVVAFCEGRAGAQVVLVGAGLDTRASRLAVEAAFYELDLPGMLDFKREALGLAPGQVLVPADLRVERVTAALARAPGFDPARPTCVIWEGVSYYLPAPVVGDVLEDLAVVVGAGAGGLVLFDYVTARWVEAATRADAGVVSQVARWGEPMISGFSDLAAELGARGLAVVEDVATEDLRPRYGLPPATERWYAGRMAAARRAS
jgi:methyltransferase (TIGR00027 family)